VADYLARIARVGARPWAVGIEQRARVPWLEGSSANASPPPAPPAIGPPPTVGGTPRTAPRNPGPGAAATTPAPADATGPARGKTPAVAGNLRRVAGVGARPGAPGVAEGPPAGTVPTGAVLTGTSLTGAAAVPAGTTGSTKSRGPRTKRTAVSRRRGQAGASAAERGAPREPTAAVAPEPLPRPAGSPAARASSTAPSVTAPWSPSAAIEQSRGSDPAPRLAGRWRIEDATAKPDGNGELPAGLGANTPPSTAARPPVGRGSPPAGTTGAGQTGRSSWPDPVPRMAGRWQTDEAGATPGGISEGRAEMGASTPPLAAALAPRARTLREVEERSLPPSATETGHDGAPSPLAATPPRPTETMPEARSTRWQPREDGRPAAFPVSKPSPEPVPPAFQLDVGRIEVLVVNQPAPAARPPGTGGTPAPFRQLSPALARFRLRR
jgi:hypothetical protein